MMELAGTKRIATVADADLLKVAADRLVIDEPTALLAPEGQLLVGGERGQTIRLDDWPRCPLPGPAVVALADCHTQAERLVKESRKTAGAGRVGDEMLLAACSLLAAEPRAVILTRWTSGGARQRELLTEFLVGLDDSSPAQAWRRSVTLARGAPVRVRFEPRVDGVEEGAPAPDASHPFFWAGFLVID